MIHFSIAGALVAVFIAGIMASTLWWMLHPPSSFVQRLAKQAESDLRRLVGSIIIVFSPDIESGHMMALAAKLAHGAKSDLLAIYILEVPFMLPADAQMPAEERAALDSLGAAEALGMQNGINIHTEIVKTRNTTQAVLDVAKRERASLIMMGSYREGKYTGAPLGSDIEEIAANAKCDVLIGVEGKHGSVLETAAPSGNDAS
ncbi:MAG TPA: universal stress protein [Candidatus Rubrimentiphilum sp.]|nr:universal stress protein [Candidatus Rubrimentiphilum sp.]